MNKNPLKNIGVLHCMISMLIYLINKEYGDNMLALMVCAG